MVCTPVPGYLNFCIDFFYIFCRMQTLVWFAPAFAVCGLAHHMLYI